MITTGSTVGPSYIALAAHESSVPDVVYAVSPSGARHPLENWQAELLARCARFSTRTQLGAFSDAQISEMEQLGLIASDQMYFNQCAERGDASEIQAIGDLGILTCASPTMLTRSVISWNALFETHGLDVRVTVADDSPSEKDAIAQRNAAAAVARSTGLNLKFIDPRRRRTIADEIASRAGVPKALMRFAFAGRPPPRNGIGGSRNVVALLLQNRVVLSADDDVLATFIRPEPAELDLWITSGDARMSLVPFDSPADISAQMRSGNTLNPFAFHARFAGRAVSTLVRETEGAGSLFEASSALANSLIHDNLTVAVSASGLAGDCGSDCQAFYSYLGTAQESRDYILAAGDRLPRSREVLRSARFPVLCDANSLMTFCYAFDNRLALPPFFPVGRGEDQAWQALLHHVLPDTLIAHLPVAVAHRPEPPREFTDTDYLDPCREFPANAFIIWAIGRFRAGEGSRNLDAIGQHFRELTDDEDWFTDSLRHAWHGYVDHHTRLVELSPGMTNQAPPWWQRRLRTIHDTLITRRHGEVPLEYANLPAGQAIAAFRSDLGRFGELLRVWQHARHAAVPLAERLTEDPDWLSP